MGEIQMSNRGTSPPVGKLPAAADHRDRERRGAEGAAPNPCLIRTVSTPAGADGVDPVKGEENRAGNTE